MKKVLVVLAIFILVLPFVVYAGDTDISIASGNQDALIIGRVTGGNDGIYAVHVENVLMGDIDSMDIEIEANPNDWKNPTVDSYYLLSVDKKAAFYVIKYCGSKIDSPDYKTLKLENANDDDTNVWTRLQKFVNSGAFVEADKKAKERKASIIKEDTKVEATIAPEATKEPMPIIQKTAKSNIELYIAIAAAVVIFLALVVILLKKNKKSK